MGSIGCEGEPYVEPFIPFLLSRIGVDDFSASFAHLRRTYLQPPPHVLATVPARTCVRPRTYLRLQTLMCTCREKGLSRKTWGKGFP